MSELNHLSPATKALGLLVVRAAALETTLVELIVRIAEDSPGVDAATVRTRYTGQSGKVLIDELRRLGRHDVADPYEALAEQRNHLVHGNGWELPDVGYHVVQARKSQRGVAQPPREKVWQVSEIEALSRQIIALEKLVQVEVRKGGRRPVAYTVTGPIENPWTPPRVELPNPASS